MRHSYIWSGKPAIVLEPRSAQEVSQAVLYAAEQNLALSVRSGGHGISGRSTNTDGIVIDLKHLNTIEVVDPARGVIRLGPGARWGEVAEKLASHGLAMSSGDYGDVGVGGLATAGGVGYFARKHGLTIDHMTAAEAAQFVAGIQAGEDRLWDEVFRGREELDRMDDVYDPHRNVSESELATCGSCVGH